MKDASNGPAVQTLLFFKEIGQIGIVQSLTEKGDVTVTFDSNATWTVHNMALSKVILRLTI